MPTRHLQLAELSPAVLARLARALGRGDPPPLLELRRARRPKLAGAAVVVGAAAALVLARQPGQPASFAVAYAAALALVAGGALLVLRGLVAGRLPVPQGRFILPRACVEVVGSTLAVHPLAELTRVVTASNGDHATVILCFAGGATPWFKERTADAPTRLAPVKAAAEAARGSAGAPDDPAAWDPFADGVVVEPEPHGPLRAPKALFSNVATLVLALAAGAALGPALWLLRHRLDG